MSKQLEPATEQQKNEAGDALIVCLHNAVLKLDDGRSEASTIALGLKPSCAAEFFRYRNVTAQDLNPAAARIFHRDDDKAFIEYATNIVLHERAQGGQKLQ